MPPCYRHRSVLGRMCRVHYFQRFQLSFGRDRRDDGPGDLIQVTAFSASGNWDATSNDRRKEAVAPIVHGAYEWLHVNKTAACLCKLLQSGHSAGEHLTVTWI